MDTHFYARLEKIYKNTEDYAAYVRSAGVSLETQEIIISLRMKEIATAKKQFAILKKNNYEHTEKCEVLFAKLNKLIENYNIYSSVDIIASPDVGKISCVQS